MGWLATRNNFNVCPQFFSRLHCGDQFTQGRRTDFCAFSWYGHVGSNTHFFHVEQCPFWISVGPTLPALPFFLSVDCKLSLIVVQQNFGTCAETMVNVEVQP